MTCKTCTGAGFIEWREFYGHWTPPERFVARCPDCTQKGICPNCGAELVEADDLDNFNNPYFVTCKCGFADPLRG